MTYIKNKNKHLKSKGIILNPIIVLTNDENLNFHVYHIFNLFFTKEVKVISKANFEDEIDYEIKINDDILNIKFLKDNEEMKRKYNDKEDIKKLCYDFLSKKLNKKLPWGTLIGVRPTKFAYSMILENKSREEIINFYKEKYFVSDKKANLALNTAYNEVKNINNPSDDEVGVYIHLPFCPTKCTYCSFITTVDKDYKTIGKYTDILIKDIEKTSKEMKKLSYKFKYIYFGGGTPTALNDDDFDRVLKSIYDNFYSDDIIEYTVECGRVDSINEEKLKSMKKYKVSRISINPQTFSDRTLEKIGRSHSSQDVIRIFNQCRLMGFDNINMDIIIGLPLENHLDTRNTALKISELKPDNVTVHALALKRGSILTEEGYNSEDEEIRKMYEEIYEKLEETDYEPYYLYRQKNIAGNLENTGFCLKGKEGHYNVLMMEDRLSIVSCGASAISKKVRKQNSKIPEIVRHEAYRDVKLYMDNIDKIIEDKLKIFK